MTLDEAYSILELSKDASVLKIKSKFRELAKKYHPDVSDGTSENASKMLEIIFAYKLIMAKINVNSQEETLNDILENSGLSNEINRFFVLAARDLIGQINKIEEGLISKINMEIDQCKTTDLLKECIKSRIPDIASRARSDIGFYVDELRNKISKKDQKSIFRRFESLYKESQKTWRNNLSRNPILLESYFFLKLIFCGTIVSTVFTSFSSIFSLTLISNNIISNNIFPLSIALSLFIIIVTTSKLYIEHESLNCKNQFLPPSLSDLELYKTMCSVSSKISESSEESRDKGGVNGFYVFGGLAGLFAGMTAATGGLALLTIPFVAWSALFTGTGTLATALASSFGKDSLNKIKSTSKKIIVDDIKKDINLLKTNIREWAKDSEIKYKDDVKQTLLNNLKKLESSNLGI